MTCPLPASRRLCTNPQNVDKRRHPLNINSTCRLALTRIKQPFESQLPGACRKNGHNGSSVDVRQGSSQQNEEGSSGP